MYFEKEVESSITVSLVPIIKSANRTSEVVSSQMEINGMIDSAYKTM
jgi:hypothetical protein